MHVSFTWLSTCQKCERRLCLWELHSVAFWPQPLTIKCANFVIRLLIRLSALAVMHTARGFLQHYGYTCGCKPLWVKTTKNHYEYRKEGITQDLQTCLCSPHVHHKETGQFLISSSRMLSAHDIACWIHGCVIIECACVCMCVMCIIDYLLPHRNVSIHT